MTTPALRHDHPWTALYWTARFVRAILADLLRAIRHPLGGDR